MSVDVNTIEVTIRAQVDQLLKSLKEAAGATGSAAGQMRDEMNSLGGGAREATPHIGGMNEALKEWRTHVRTEARYTTFMAAQVAGLGIASKGAAAEITGLVSAFAFGGGLGVAVEGVKMLVHILGEAGKATEEAKTKIKEYAAEAAKGITSIREHVDKMIMSLTGAGKAEELWYDKVRPLLTEEFELKQKLMTAEHKLADARETLKKWGESEADIVAWTHKEALAVEVATAALNRKQEAIRKGNEEVKRLGTAEETHDKAKDDAADEKTEAAHNLRMLTLKAQLLDGEQKLRAEFAAEVARIRAREDTTGYQDDQEIALQKELLEKNITNLQAEQLAKREEAHRRHMNAIIKAEYQAAEALKKFFAGQADDRLKEYERIQGETQKKMQEFAAVAQKLGATVGQVFQGLADGSLTLSKAFSKMAASIIHELVAMAIIAIKANAGIAGAEAAASVASTPFAGPFLAIAAMSMVEGAVLGLLSLVSSKGGLGTVPYDGTLAMLHKDETVLPAALADRYRRGADSLEGGGGGSSGEMHLHIHAVAVDGPSVRKLINSHEFKREMRDAGRRGAM